MNSNNSEFPYQWKKSALLIVGHGSTENPDSSAPTHRLVDELRARDHFAEVHAAFWKEDAGLREALAMIDSSLVFVVPNFISEGYFTTEVIPRELGIPEGVTNHNVNGKTLIYCRPSGVHPAMSSLLVKRAREVIGTVSPEDCSLVVVGHGTALNKKSRQAVEQRVAEVIAANTGFGEVIDAYMEESPLINEWDRFTTKPNVVTVPFFIADGLHSYQDIPVLLGIESEPTEAASQREIFRHNPHQLRGKTLFYSSAIGTDPEMIEVILDLVCEADTPDVEATASDQETNAHFLDRVLDGGSIELGELHISGSGSSWMVCHRDDFGSDGLELFISPADAFQIALYNDAGDYRPLRTAPDLRHGWQMQLATVEELRQALDYLYPAAVGLSRLNELGKLKVCHFRDKLGRQTGMYRSARSISDAGANTVIKRCCNHQDGCLKHRLWSIVPGREPELARTTPPGGAALICQEPCNLLVAESRKAAREEVIKIDA